MEFDCIGSGHWLFIYFRLSLKHHCIHVCIRGYNCCQTGIELSKFSFHGCKNRTQLAVQIKICYKMDIADASTTTKVKTCENLCFCPSILNGIHGKLNKIDFLVQILSYLSLGRLLAIIIDI